MKRHAPAIGLDPSLRGALAPLSNGRVLVIDSFRNVRCGCATGDITVAWRREQPVGDFVELGLSKGSGYSRAAVSWGCFPSLNPA